MISFVAAVHLSPFLTVPVLLLAAVGGVAYWRRLSRASVPKLRRRLRRAGLLVGLVGAVAGVAAISFIDPDLEPVAYLVAWGLVAAVLVPAVTIAAMDAVVTVRFHQRSLERRAVRDAARIRAAVVASPSSEASGDEPERPAR